MKILIGMILAVIGFVFLPLQTEAMNKADLVDAIAASSNLTKADSNKALNAYINAVSRELKRGGTVDLVGFGSFLVENGPMGKTVRFQPGQDLLGGLSVTPPPPPSKTSCAYTLSKISQIFNASGGGGSFSVTVDSLCNWQANKDTSWIVVTSGGNGPGNGPVNFTVQPNTGTGKRMGGITVGDKTFTVTQYGKGRAAAEGKPRPH